MTRSYLDQRVGKVPLSVVRNLEHALKETEASCVDHIIMYMCVFKLHGFCGTYKHKSIGKVLKAVMYPTDSNTHTVSKTVTIHSSIKFWSLKIVW